MFLFCRSCSPKYIYTYNLDILMLQSSGKSSVLESIVGKDFLPRGSGTLISLLINGYY